MNRDENIKKIRPILKLADVDKKPIELFQNETLRPIIKLQHELTLSLLSNHKNYKPDHLSKGTMQQYEIFLTKYIKTNLELKNQLIGAIIGIFTTNELSFYITHRKEINKRMMQMQLKRFVDTIYTAPTIH